MSAPGHVTGGVAPLPARELRPELVRTWENRVRARTTSSLNNRLLARRCYDDRMPDIMARPAGGQDVMRPTGRCGQGQVRSARLASA